MKARSASCSAHCCNKFHWCVPSMCLCYLYRVPLTYHDTTKALSASSSAWQCAGTVTATTTLHVTVGVRFKPSRLTEQTWRIQKLGNIVTFKRCMAALLKVVETSMQPAGVHSPGTCIVYMFLYSFCSAPWCVMPDCMLDCVSVVLAHDHSICIE